MNHLTTQTDDQMNRADRYSAKRVRHISAGRAGRSVEGHTGSLGSLGWDRTALGGVHRQRALTRRGRGKCTRLGSGSTAASRTIGPDRRRFRMRAALSWVKHLLVVPILLGLASVGSAQDVRYIYDDLNRLVGVIDPSGEAAGYTYDAVGNILAVTRYSAGQVSILGFSPGSGPVGTTVIIAGTGFSRTLAENTVTFNGMAA